MKYKLFTIFIFYLAKNILAQTGAPQQASNILNPNISVVTNLLGSFGNDKTLNQNFFTFDEAEVGLQAVVDPYARADIFVAFSSEEFELEEGYFTWLTMPFGLQSRFGKFRSNWNSFNLIHPPETPFADRPLSIVNFLGEEGVVGTGVSLSWLVPINLFYLKWIAEVTNLPEESPSFGIIDTLGELVQSERRQDLAYLLRSATYFDLSESSNLSYGFTYVGGVNNPSGKLWTHLSSFDFTFRFRNPKRAIYSSFLWRNEILMSQREIISGRFLRSWGGFSHINWQFLRRWHIGGRYDYSQFTDDNNNFEQGGLTYLAFTPSEFSVVSIQGRYVKRADQRDDWAGFVKLTFNIGPHGAHQF
ncbi:MAG: hypothetical protein A2145_05835 [candidate division Zixibacteria bacterium RBG_16_40_9]|nr:MAG: hypothetical protein A2145_05835 [candidate division Zixibacteria bacterium RBG_16_40_9]